MSEETVEIEIDEESIVGYLVDEDDNEIGVLYVNEAGEEVELYYDDCEQVDEVEEEVEEMEIDPDSILYYFVDTKGRELGFAALNEAGEKEEYLYPEEAIERFYLLSDLEKKLSQATGVKGAAGSLVSAGTNAVGGVVNKVTGKEVIKTTDGAVAKPGDGEGMTKDDFADMFSTFKEVAVSGYSALTGVMDQVDDVRDSLDEINPKKRRQNRKAKKDTEAAVAAALAQQQATTAAAASVVAPVTPVAEAAPAAEVIAPAASTEPAAAAPAE